jgi:hypothetical protein
MHEGVAALLGQVAEDLDEDRGAQEGLEGGAGREWGGLRFEPGADVREAGALQPGGGLLGRGEVLSPGELGIDRVHGLADGLDVAGAATLSDQPTARAQHGGQVAEQPLVVVDPVEGGRRQDDIDRLRDGQRPRQVSDHVLDARVGPQSLARPLDHRR